MTCTDWRLGISPMIWATVRQHERPRSGSDCASRKCESTGKPTVRYTICRVPRRLEPRLRIYANGRMTASLTVASFEEGQRLVDRLIGRR